MGAAAILPAPVPGFEPGRVGAKTAFAYRLAQSDSPGARALLGESVTPKGLMMHLQFAGTPARAIPCEVKGVVGPVVEAFCPWDAVPRLAALPGLVRAEPTLDRKKLRPALPKSTTLDVTGVTRAVERTWPQRSAGHGVVVADFDSGFDPFAPQHFRADGGRFAWLDLDHDGIFTPGTDAVDFNRNGVFDVGERVLMIKPTFFSEYTGSTFDPGAAFIPGVDWLFQDEDGNGKRDFGPSFGDAKPTFGEQLFVADDVDGNGRLDPGEPLVALHTPRVAAIHTQHRIYRRDVDLSQYPVPDEQHANMVIGTLAGGDVRLTRYHGAAPDAEILLIENTDMDVISAAQWAKNEGAQIMLWEEANWFLEFLDGSSPLETALDAFVTNDGILQLAAAGNLSTSKKHFEQTLAAGAAADLPITVPSQTPAYIILTLLWHGDPSLSVTAHWGTETLALDSAGQGALGAASTSWWLDTSPRGTHELNFYLTLDHGAPPGDFSLHVTSANTSDVVLRGYLCDADSSWGLGVAWDLPSVTDKSTYGTPAVGDHTLAVATWQVDWPYHGTAGDLTYWSSHGPRFDGADTIDFAVPEDSWTAPYSRLSVEGSPFPFGSWVVGAGTSNALPMATGIAAVLLSANPTWKAPELTEALKHGAAADSFTGAVPNDRWGYGKLSAYRALTAMDPPAHTGPAAGGSALRREGVLYLDGTGSTGEALQYRWDVGVDGTFELDASAEVHRQLNDASGAKWVELEVADPSGFAAAKVIPIVDEVVSDALGAPEVLSPVVKKGCGCDTGSLPILALALAVLARLLRSGAGRHGDPRTSRWPRG